MQFPFEKFAKQKEHNEAATFQVKNVEKLRGRIIPEPDRRRRAGERDDKTSHHPSIIPYTTFFSKTRQIERASTNKTNPWQKNTWEGSSPQGQ
jgi:hypothetical protein